MDYRSYLQKALLTAVHDILETVAQEGIEPDCAYYLTLETNREDVALPDFVRQKYPTEITLVLENQFENLCVDSEKITVDLAFGGVSSTVCIPFRAIKQFADPHHNFVLAFQPQPPAEPQKTTPKIIRLDDLRK